jgi:hypothetical protein
MSAITPPRAGPAIEPAPVAPRAVPRASPRFPGRAVSETNARAEIQLAAEPMPWIARAANRTPIEFDAAMRTDPAATSNRPPANSGRLPIESAARPSGSDRRAIGTAYAARARPRAASPAPVLCSIAGSSGAIKPRSAESTVTAPTAIAMTARRLHCDR